MDIDNELKLLILCGGKGTRVASIANGRPKSLLKIGDNSLLDIVLSKILNEMHFNDVYLLTGYGANQIKDYYTENNRHGVKFHFLEETQVLGTGGCVLNAISKIGAGKFLVINGDTIIDANVREFAKFAFSSKLDIAVAAFSVDDTRDYGGIEINSNNDLTSFVEKGQQGAGLVNSGMYCFSNTKNIREYVYNYDQVTTPTVSMERDILCDKALEIKVWVDESGQFLDVGTPNRFNLALKNYE